MPLRRTLAAARLGRDAEWVTIGGDVDVLGISRDSCYAHSRFIQEYSRTFPLLSDVERTVTEACGVRYDEWELHSGVPRRAVFVVDSDRVVRYAWVTEDAHESPDISDLWEQVTALESDSSDATGTP